MSKMLNNAEKFIWNNLKMYLMQYPTCFLDNLLKVKNENADLPIDRYEDFPNQFENHIKLGSYVVDEAAQFDDLPFVTVNIAPIDTGNCSTRVVMGFDIAFTTDSPRPSRSHPVQYVGNSSEAVASFRANICNGLYQLFHDALGPEVDACFWDRLRDTTLPNPVKPSETKQWMYNIVGQVDEDNTISDVTQLKREDRSSGIALFHVVFTMDINKLYGDGIDCGC